MSWRFLGLLACVATVAISCGSDDDQQASEPEAAGAGGESEQAPEPKGGSTSTGQAGTANSGGAPMAVAGQAGAASTSGGGGAGGSAEPPDSAGGASGAGGASVDLPDAPVSACGAGKYDTGDGCTQCPAAPSSAKAIDCDGFGYAQLDGEGTLHLDFGPLELHEPQSGSVILGWVSNDLEGEAEVDWEYSLVYEQFLFQLPLEARYADQFMLRSWVFTDSCAFSFKATSFAIHWDGVETWQCDN